MTDLDTHKQSILEITADERLSLVSDLRQRRRESISSTAITKSAAPKKKIEKKKTAGVVKKLDLSQAKALLKQLQEGNQSD